MWGQGAYKEDGELEKGKLRDEKVHTVGGWGDLKDGGMTHSEDWGVEGQWGLVSCWRGGDGGMGDPDMWEEVQ